MVLWLFLIFRKQSEHKGKGEWWLYQKVTSRLVETVADSLLIFRFWTSTVLIFLVKMAFKLLKEKVLEMIPKYWKAQAQIWPEGNETNQNVVCSVIRIQNIYISLTNQKCRTPPTIINFHPNKYTQILCCYPFVVILDRCVRSWNTPNDLSKKVSIPNKTKDLNLSLFNIITRINESQTLTNDISCECTVNLMVKNAIQIKSGITINVNAKAKNIIYVKSCYI